MKRFYNNVFLQAVVILALFCGETALRAAEVRFENQPPVIVEALQAQGAAKPAHTRTARIVTLTERIDVYTYRLTDEGKAVWMLAGQVAIGELVKVGGCAGDGYAQIEYRDPDRPGWWRVAFKRCVLLTE